MMDDYFFEEIAKLKKELAYVRVGVTALTIVVGLLVVLVLV